DFALESESHGCGSFPFTGSLSIILPSKSTGCSSNPEITDVGDSEEHIFAAEIPGSPMLSETERANYPQNLQELQDPIRPGPQSPSRLPLPHCSLWWRNKEEV
ncbi:hypothetical protein F2P56_000747, partial [Juglans regia]